MTVTSQGCQGEYLALPAGGWALAEDNADAVAVRSTALLQTYPTWGQRYVCMCVDEISSAYATSNDGTSCGCKASHHEMSAANVGNDDKAPGLCAQCPVGAYQPANDFSGAACISCPAGEQSKPVQRTGRCAVRSGKAPRQTDAHAFSLGGCKSSSCECSRHRLGRRWHGVVLAPDAAYR